MRVVTWNAQHGRPNPDGEPDIARAVAPLGALEADIYGLQELDCGRRRSKRVDQPRVVADGLGGELVWAPALQRGGQYGIALVVRGPVLVTQVLRLPGRGEPRVLVVAQVEVDGSLWTVGCTHLSTHRAVAALQLVAAFDELNGWPLPRVLLGDMNITPEAVLPWSSADGYQLVEGPPTHSTRTARPTVRIDHVLVAGARIESAAVHDIGVSDHLAVAVDLGGAGGGTDYRRSVSPLA